MEKSSQEGAVVHITLINNDIKNITFYYVNLKRICFFTDASKISKKDEARFVFFKGKVIKKPAREITL